MSNATTLQTNNNKLSVNNTDLASILTTINNLPEAGSGGSVETGTLELIIDDNIIYVAEDGDELQKGTMNVYYTDENMTTQIKTISHKENSGNSASIICPLNTPILIETNYGFLGADYDFVASGIDYIDAKHRYNPIMVYASTRTSDVYLLPMYLTSSSGSFTMKLYE